jgi:hypothetical protein
MAEFLKGNHLNSRLDEILENAEEKLVLISPFIKFHSRIKEILRTKKHNDKLLISVVFGKNEDKKQKSFAQEDFDFLSEFPRVEIRFEPRLHAKYYANESASLLSSMNLYEYSQNNNIEFGIFSQTSFMDSIIKSTGVDRAAWDYFEGVQESSQLLFQKVPVYEDKLMGLKKKYIRSDVEVDKLSEIYGVQSQKTQSKQQSVEVRQSAEADKNKIKEVRAAKVASKNSKVLSASKIAAKFGSSVTAKKVQSLMESKGYLIGDEITDAGANIGLVKKNYMGNDYIAYPEDLEDFQEFL